MNLERITNIDHPMYKDAIKLYKMSFPLHEQRETPSQSAIISNKSYHFDIIFENGVFAGKILYWEANNFFYIEHFCILPEMRNKCYGQRALTLLKGKKLILEIDPPNDEISIRRKGFYERCGLRQNPYLHIHPPYHREDNGHRLVIMSSQRKLTAEEYSQFNDFLQNTVMKDAFI